MTDRAPGTLSEVARNVLAGLPPGMLLLVGLFGGLIWYLDNQDASRAEATAKRIEAVTQLLDKCITK
jgi:NAD-dependent oxidoreductase involved in siderophore biosynthesis